MCIHYFKSTLASFLLLLILLVGTPKLAFAADGNGIFTPRGGAVVQGTVAIQGIARHEAFRKWQLDLLINGDEKQSDQGVLTNLDTTRFPNGNYRLRLRVVHKGLNYDEYFIPLTINNPNAPAALDVPPAGDAPEPTPIPTPSNQPLGQGVPDGKRWIEVDISNQTLTAWQGDAPVLKTQVSTGKPGYETVTGTFYINNKLRYAHMIGPDYNTPDVPWTMYYYQGFAVHGAYWHNNFGRPVSHGCVNMRVNESKLLFEWASVGTQVVVHE